MAKTTETRVAEAVGASIGIFLASLLLLIGVLPVYFAFRLGSTRRITKRGLARISGGSGFCLTQAEKIRLNTLTEMLNGAIEKRDRAISEAYSAGITKNQDGQFSMRSHLGKKLRQEIDSSQELISEASPEIEELRNRPANAWKKFTAAYDERSASILGLSVFGVYLLFPLLGLEITPQPIKDSFPSFLKFWYIGVFVAGSVYCIRRYIFCPSSRFESKKPVVVPDGIVQGRIS